MTLQDKFFELCETGNLEKLKKLNYNKIDIHDGYEYAFEMACENGHLDVVKYLIWLGENGHGKINIHDRYRSIFRYTCSNKHLSIVKYLLWLGENGYGKIDIHDYYDYAFYMSNFSTKYFLVKQDPEYDWKHVLGYKPYSRKLYKLLSGLIFSCHYLANQNSDITEFHVIGIVKEYLFG